MEKVLKQHRETIRALRDLSFNLEPVVLRDQGFGPAVKALAEQLGLEHQIQIDVDVDAAEALGEKRAGRALPDHPRGDVRVDPPRAADADVDHGRPSGPTAGSQAEIADDAPGERRRATFEELAERARTLNGRFEVDQRDDDGGTTVRVSLPPYATAVESPRRDLPALRLDADRLRAPRAGGRAAEASATASRSTRRASGSRSSASRRSRATLAPALLVRLAL